MAIGKPATTAIFMALLVAALPADTALAREDVQEFSIQEGLSGETAQQKLSGKVDFYFGKQAHPHPAESLGTFVTAKRVDALARPAEEACKSAFASAMAALESQALQTGGNAVVNIMSNYDDTLTESQTTFKCGADDAMAGVALQGRIVKFPRQN